MNKPHETPAVHGNERTNPAGSRVKRSVRTVRGASVSFAAGQASAVVRDVAGAIVTGVLGGD